MRPGYVGIDLAIAKNKYLPVVVCTWEQGHLIPQPLRRLSLTPPQGRGNAATLDRASVRRFAREAATYVAAVCERLELTPTRIGVDAPSAPRSPHIARRAAETALDEAGISCFATPSAHEFDVIRAKLAQHLGAGGAEDRLPHANQLWMLVGFAVFDELSRLAPCLEVFPQATARAMGSGQVHKSQPGAVEAQLSAAARCTGWPLHRAGECRLEDTAWGPSHDQLDAYLSAWVASLEEADRVAYGRPPDDAIWVPRVRRTHSVPSFVEPSGPPAIGRAPVTSPTVSFLCPACGQKEFKRWPWGWDAHAAHVCRGLSETEPERRKAEFRRRFGHHLQH
jgi:Protein of unknown function (DUF429)